MDTNTRAVKVSPRNRSMVVVQPELPRNQSGGLPVHFQALKMRTRQLYRINKDIQDHLPVQKNELVIQPTNSNSLATRIMISPRGNLARNFQQSIETNSNKKKQSSPGYKQIFKMDSSGLNGRNQQLHGWSGHTINTGRSAIVIGNPSNINQDESAANSSNHHNNQLANHSVSRFQLNNHSLNQDSIEALIKTQDQHPLSTKKEMLKGSESIKANMKKASNNDSMRQESSELISSTRNHININDIPIASGQHRRISTFDLDKQGEKLHKVSPQKLRKPQIIIQTKKSIAPQGHLQGKSESLKESKTDEKNQIIKTFEEVEENQMSQNEIIESLMMSENIIKSPEIKGVARSPFVNYEPTNIITLNDQFFQEPKIISKRTVYSRNREYVNPFTQNLPVNKTEQFTTIQTANLTSDHHNPLDDIQQQDLDKALSPKSNIISTDLISHHQTSSMQNPNPTATISNTTGIHHNMIIQRHRARTRILQRHKDLLKQIKEQKEKEKQEMLLGQQCIQNSLSGRNNQDESTIIKHNQYGGHRIKTQYKTMQITDTQIPKLNNLSLSLIGNSIHGSQQNLINNNATVSVNQIAPAAVPEVDSPIHFSKFNEISQDSADFPVSQAVTQIQFIKQVFNPDRFNATGTITKDNYIQESYKKYQKNYLITSFDEKEQSLKMVNRDNYPSNILFPAKRMLNFPKLKLQSEKPPTKEQGVSCQRGSYQEYDIINTTTKQSPQYLASLNKTRLSSLEGSTSPKMRIVSPLLHSEGMSFKVTVKKSDIKAQLGLQQKYFFQHMKSLKPHQEQNRTVSRNTQPYQTLKRNKTLNKSLVHFQLTKYFEPEGYQSHRPQIMKTDLRHHMFNKPSHQEPNPLLIQGKNQVVPHQPQKRSSTAENYNKRKKQPRTFQTMRVRVNQDQFQQQQQNHLPFQNEVIKSRQIGEDLTFSQEFRNMMEL